MCTARAMASDVQEDRDTSGWDRLTEYYAVLTNQLIRMKHFPIAGHLASCDSLALPLSRQAQRLGKILGAVWTLGHLGKTWLALIVLVAVHNRLPRHGQNKICNGISEKLDHIGTILKPN